MSLVWLDRKSARAPWSVARGRRGAQPRRSSSAENEMTLPLSSFSAGLLALESVVASVNRFHRSVPTAHLGTSQTKGQGPAVRLALSRGIVIGANQRSHRMTGAERIAARDGVRRALAGRSES